MKLKIFSVRNVPAVLANLSAALAEILLLASSAWLIASAALQPPLSSLAVGITLVRTAGIFRAAIRYADRFFSHKVIFKFLDELREEIFLSATSKIFPATEGDLLHRLTVEADTAKNFLPRVVLPVSTAAFVTALLTFFLVDAIGIYATILPINFFVVLTMSWHFKSHDADDSAYREKILDCNDGRDELKIFGTTPAVNRLDDAAKTFGSQHIAEKSRDINFDTFTKIFNAACTCAILYEISLHADRVTLTIWALVLIATATLYHFQIKFPRLQKNFSATENFPKQVSEKIFAVRMDNVNFSYGKQVVLRNFNLNVQRGEFVKIAGESGAGKTTLLYLMTKIFQPNSGTVEVNGKIAAATSTNYIFSASIRENFEILHEKISEEKILSTLKLCQLENFDIDLPIGEDAAKLSGGERGRLQVALAMAGEPEILILDEPTAGLDKNLAAKLLSAVVDDSRKKNRTLILITHDDLNLNLKTNSELKSAKTFELLQTNN